MRKIFLGCALAAAYVQAADLKHRLGRFEKEIEEKINATAQCED